MCRGYLESGLNLLKLFLTPSDSSVIASSDDVTAEQCDAVLALARRTRDEQTRRLRLITAFWLSHSTSGKATMHGFGMVARQFLHEPPGAGVLSSI
jgi:hypothetical protein